ncbi:MAG: hypothetical protein ACQPRJ_00575 [Solitalea-like symbiont of Acarus siro]
MKKKYYLKKILIVCASLLLLMHLSSCSDDYLLHKVNTDNGTGGLVGEDGNDDGNGNNNGDAVEDDNDNNGNGNGDNDGNGNGNGDAPGDIAGGDQNDNTTPPTNNNLLDALADADQGVKTHEITKDQLAKIDSNLANLRAKVYVRAYPGRSIASTKPIIVLTQSLFGQSIKKRVSDYTDQIQKDANAKNNFFIIVDNIQTLPDTTKFKLKHTLGVTSMEVKGYKSLREKATDIFGTNITDIANFGSIYYDGKQIDIYSQVYDVIKLAAKLLEQGQNWKFNSGKAAVVAFDPFMSTIAVDLAASNKATPNINATITSVATTTPIMKFSQGKAYPSIIGNVDSTYANIGYKINILNIISDLADAHKGKLLFNALRIYGKAEDNFFGSLAGGGATHNLISKYSTNKISDIKFYFLTGGDSADSDSIDKIKGQKLLLDDNVTSDKVGMKAIVTAAANVTNTNVVLSDSDYNFPATDGDADKYISNTPSEKGLIKYIVEQN